jgi:hypothetical protein
LKVTINGSGKILPIFIPQIKPGNIALIYGVTGATSSGEDPVAFLTYTLPSTYGLQIGDRVTITGITGDAEQLKYNQTGLIITALSPTVLSGYSTTEGPSDATVIAPAEGMTAIITTGPAPKIVGITSATCTTAGGGVGATLVYVVGDVSKLAVDDRISVAGLTGTANQILFNQANMTITEIDTGANSITALSTGLSPGDAGADQIAVAQALATITNIGVLESINNTIYSITVNAAIWIPGEESGGAEKFVTSGPVFVQWIPELFDLGTPLPRGNSPTQEETDYYYLYSYNHWVVLLNLALQAAYNRLQAYADVALADYVLLNRCPTVEYDENNRKFSFYTDTLGTNWGLTQGPPTVAGLGPDGTNVLPTDVGEEFMYVGYNNNFDLLMTNFDTQYFGLDQIVWGTDVSGPAGESTTVYLPENTLIVRNKTGTNVQTQINPATGRPYTSPLLSYVTTQDFQSLDTIWSPVSSIVLVTTLIPIRSEFVSAPVTLGKSNVQSGGTSGTSSFQTVLCDFNDEIAGENWRGLITYVPENNQVSLTTSHQEVKSVDFKICWRNRLTNQLIPLLIPNTGSILVRLLFKRKSSA